MPSEPDPGSLLRVVNAGEKMHQRAGTGLQRREQIRKARNRRALRS